jgi:hypothetical protein
VTSHGQYYCHGIVCCIQQQQVLFMELPSQCLLCVCKQMCDGLLDKTRWVCCRFA